MFSQYKVPPLFESCDPINFCFDKIDAQNGINEQWAEPVTGSSRIVA